MRLTSWLTSFFNRSRLRYSSRSRALSQRSRSRFRLSTVRTVPEILEIRALLSLTTTATSISASTGTISFGMTETLTATVVSVPSGQTPTGGQVTFYDGATQIGQATLSAGTASLPTTSLTLGLHSIHAVYAGNGSTFAGSSSGVGPNSIITTVAGGSVGDNGAATGATLNLPSGMAMDSSGNLFIADQNNHIVREVVKSTGVISTVAGNGNQGYGGDGGEATDANLQYPTSVALDTSGHLFVADSGNDAIRSVNLSTGIITTIAGNGFYGSSGDGGLASDAQLAYPTGVATDTAGDLFISDSDNHRIREITASTGIISNVAGNGTAGFSGDGSYASIAKLNQPGFVTLDSSGNLFIVDSRNDRIRKVILSTGVITTIAGTGTYGSSGDGGQATLAQLGLTHAPSGVAADSSGNLFIADGLNNRIRKVILSTGVISTIAGSGITGFTGDAGQATAAAMYEPNSVLTDSSGNLFIADSLNQRVREVNSSTRVITTVAGSSGDGVRANAAALSNPRGMAVDSSGNVYVVDQQQNRVREVVQSTGLIINIAGNGILGFGGDGGQATAAYLYYPSGVAVDASGNLYISEAGSDDVRKVNMSTGLITTVAGNGVSGFSGDGNQATAAELDSPENVAVDSSGNLFILDTYNNRVREVNASTGIITTVAGNGTSGFSGDNGQATDAELDYPIAAAIDASGNLYIADQFNYRVRAVNLSTGVITTVAGSGAFNGNGDGGQGTAAGLYYPNGLAIDTAGNLFISDDRSSIRVLNLPTGIISTLAGPGVDGVRGDGGRATAANLQETTGLALDASGNLYIADLTDERIRKITSTAQVQVNQVLTATSVTPSAGTIVGGMTETLTATVATVASGAATPTGGTVTFYDGLTQLGQGTLTAGTATFQTSALGIGLHAIRAAYSGDGLNFAGSTTSVTPNSIITTVAGGDIGDGKAATIATLNAPSDVTVDSAGNMYVVEFYNDRVRKINQATGIITTIAGNGINASSGDGGQATDASLNYPRSVVIDADGNLLISEYLQIRKVTLSTGIITTIAGGGSNQGDGEQATSANIAPYGMAISDSGDLLFSDVVHYRVREVDHNTGIITTVAGNGTRGFGGDLGQATNAMLSAAYDIAIDTSGDLFIADTDNFRVRMVNLSTGVINTVAGNGNYGSFVATGLATAVAIDSPVGVTVDASGNLFIADDVHDCVRKVNLGTQVLTTVAGNGTPKFAGDGGRATAANLNRPQSVSFDNSGNLLIADQDNNRIRKVSITTGIITTVAGSSGDGQLATSTSIYSPLYLASDSSGNVYIANESDNSIHKVSAATGIISTVAGNGSYGSSGDGGQATAASLPNPGGLAIDGAGNLYIACFYTIRKVNLSTGIISTFAGSDLGGSSGDGGQATAAKLGYVDGLTLDSSGNLLIADSGDNRIRAINLSTGIITTIAGNRIQGSNGDGGQASAAELGDPAAIAVDSSGNMYIADYLNNLVRKVTKSTGVISTIVGLGVHGFNGDGRQASTATLFHPSDVAVDSSGNLLIVDQDNERIRRVNLTTGIISTLVGTGGIGFNGDGGAASAAMVNSPTDLALDALGDVFLVDSQNRRIREIPSSVSVQVNPPISITPTALSNWTQNQSGYNQTIVASGGINPHTFALSTGLLPHGLSLNSSTGAITGTPDVVSGSTFTIAATDSLGTSATQQYTITINAPVGISTSTLADWTQNQAGYSQTIATTSGTSPFAFAPSAGTLPHGLSLNASTGAVSGTPDVSGTSTFTIKVVDAAGSTAARAYTVTTNLPVSISTSALANWTQSFSGYMQTVSASGGTNGLSFGVATGTLPHGLNLNSTTGAVTGTPDTAGTSTFTITAVDGIGATDTRQYTVTINAAVAITSMTLSNWTQNQAGYGQTVAASGGTTPLSFSVSSGTLPHGLSLAGSSGAITGTPDTLGNSTFTISVQDILGSTAAQQYTLTVNPVVTISTNSLTGWTQNLPAYSQTVTTSGGTTPLTFGVLTGALPHGLSLNASTGAVTGTPDTAGTATFSVRVVDAAGSSATRSYTVTVNPAVSINTATLSNWTQCFAGYAQTVSASGGTNALTFGVATGSLPHGLSLNASTGAITGTPDTAGTTTFSITAADSLGASATSAYTVTINPPVSITSATLATWTQSAAGYRQTVSSNGGTGAIAYSVPVGTLPHGLSLNSSTGIMSGTPDLAGATTFTIEAQDAVGSSTTRQFTVTINSPVAIATATLVNWTQNIAGYSQTFATTSGTAPVSFGIAAGTLPHGLSLNASTGTVTGTPDTAGTATFSVRVVDAAGSSAMRSYTVTVNPTVSINTATLSNWTQSFAGYAQTVSASGGTNALTFGVATGSLPHGLSLNSSTGAITGTPDTAGSAMFSIKATDSLGASATRAYTVTINLPMSITTAALANWTQNAAGYNQTVATSGGTAPAAFNVSAGTLPHGLSLNASTGTLTGTPDVAGTTTFSVRALDSVGSSATKQYVVAVNAPVAIATATLANWTQNATGYSQTLVTTGGTAPVALSVSTGSLPHGLSLNTSTGLLAGTPDVAGTTTFTVKALDAVGASATKQYTVTINAAVAITTATLPNWTQSFSGYSQSVSATGGTGALTFSLASGALPHGLGLNSSTGAITGTPDTLGTAAFTIRAVDTVGGSSSRAYSVTINAAPTGAWSTIASPTHTPVSSATITFSAAVRNVSLNDFTLNGTDVSTLAGASLSNSGNAYTISGLAASDSAGNPSKNYTIAVAVGNDIQDLVGAPLAGTPNVTWTMDTLAPAGSWGTVTTPTKTAVNSVAITFTEGMQNVSLGGFTLNGTALSSLTGSGTVSLSNSGNVYTISGLAGYDAAGNPNRTYTLAVAAGNSIQDLAGNALSSLPTATWTMDTQPPTASWTAVATPTKTAVNSASIAFSESVQNVSLGSFTLNGTALSALTGHGAVTLSNSGNSYSLGGLSGYTATGNPNTLYTLAIAAGNGITDAAGNSLSGTPSVAWTMDTIVPTASVTTAAPTITAATGSSNSTTIKITYADATSGVNTSTFGVSNITVSNGATVSGFSASGNVVTYTIKAPASNWNSSAQGTYTVALAGTVQDRAGNAITANASLATFKVDTARPTATVTTVPPAINLSTGSGNTTTIKLTYADGTTGVNPSTFAPSNLTVNNGATVSGFSVSGNVVTYTITAAGASWSASTQGVYTVGLAGTVQDLAGNAIAANASLSTFLVDTIAPKAVVTKPAPKIDALTDGATTTTINITYSDAAAGVNSSTFGLSNITVSNGATVTAFSASGNQVTYTITAAAGARWIASTQGTYTISLAGTVKDLAGNAIAPVASLSTFTVAALNPAIVSVTRTTPASSPTNATSLTYTVTFNQPVTGVDAGDFHAVTAGGASVANPLSVAGSGAVYTVTISGITGTGTVGLNLTDNGSIHNLAGAPLVKSTSAAAFATALNMTVGAVPVSLATGDVNGDGRADLIVADFNGGGVSVLLGNANGTFAPPRTFSIPNSPVSVAVADLNGDGRSDLVVADAGLVSVLLGNGNGTFAAPQSVTTGGRNSFVTAVDVNGDGRLDLAAANLATNSVNVLLGNGNGTFALGQSLATAGQPEVVQGADVNGDGRLDLVVAGLSDNLVNVFLGNGNGTFAAPKDFATGSSPRSLAIADLNSDGRLDLAVANFGSNTASVLLGNGNGTFAAGQNLATGSGPLSIAAVDVNGDGHADLATANYSSKTVSVLVGNGNGSFVPAQSLATGSGAYSVAAADMNGDGHPDLGVANSLSNSVSVLIGGANGSFTGQTTAIDNTRPTATVTTFAPTINAATGAATTTTIKITYADASAGVNTSTFGTSNIAVSNGATVTGFSASGNAVTYTLTAPAGAKWSGSPQGTYTVSLTGTVKDLAGNAIATNLSLSTFQVDTVAPTASVTTAAPTINVAAGTATTTTIKITYADGTAGVNTSTFGTSNITVSNGATVSGFSASGNAVTYTIKAPGGAKWNASPQGTYTINLASTVKDLAGNAIAARSSLSTFLVDTVAPTLTAVYRSSPANQVTNATSVVFLAKFSEAVSGVDANVAADFALTGTATAGGKIGTPTTNNGGLSWSIPVTGLSGTANGTVQLNLTHNTGIKDVAANLLATTTQSGPSYVLDHIAPTLTSINRASPTSQYTTASSVTYLVTFSEPVTGVNTNVASDFALTGTAIAEAKIGTPSTNNGGLSWSIPVTGLSSTATGTLQLNLTHNTGIVDPAGNKLATATFSGQAYALDHTAPVGTWTPVSTPTKTAVASVKITFSEPVQNVTLASFTLNGTKISTLAGATLTALSGNQYVIGGLSAFDTAAKTYTIAVIAGNSIKDLAGNALATNPSMSWVVSAAAPAAVTPTTTAPAASNASPATAQLDDFWTALSQAGLSPDRDLLIWS